MKIQIEGSISELHDAMNIVGLVDKTECVAMAAEFIEGKPMVTADDIRQIVSEEIKNNLSKPNLEILPTKKDSERASKKLQSKKPALAGTRQHTQKTEKKTVISTSKNITLEEIKEQVDLSECNTIPEVINKIQLETNITGTLLAELLGLNVPDISIARSGKIFPYIEKAFNQHLGFKVKI